MRRLFTFSSLLIAFLLPSFVMAQQTYPVSKERALSVVQSLFHGQDVDFYLCEDAVLNVRSRGENFTFSQSDTWTFFVDAEPLKGWEHDCYLVSVAKRQARNQLLMPKSIKFRLPPNGNFTPLAVKNRYGTKANQKPYVRKAILSNEVRSAAGRTYVVILSGGHNKYSNYERYWNDCSFIYQTLVNKYGVPKSNISVVMSDGTNPAADMKATTGGFKSSPLDLDNDGQPDLQYAATRANVKNVLSNLSQRIRKDDHLFFYVIDHGGTRDHNNQSYICLWNGESLHDYELAEWLQPFNDKSVHINVVLGQCFSGGFIEELSKVGCVVAAASKGSESSWACPDIPYDEFVYQWTSAINEGNAFGQSVFSDADNNHRVTMEEAFDYAYQHDRRRPKENPQYKSNPKSVGEDLAFNNLPKAVDLYIKDNDKDTGKEPNLTTDIFWDSPDIWVRNDDDDSLEHQNPEYSKKHRSVMVYVRVHNRGKEDYKGGLWLHAYWAKASTGLTVKAWKGEELYNNKITGYPLRAEHIPEIKAGESTLVKLDWLLPSNLLREIGDNETEKHHFCLLARITNFFEEDGFANIVPNSYVNVTGSNDIAQKNVSIINKEALSKGTSVFVRNIYKGDHKYSLEIHPRTLADKSLLSKAKLKMEMASPIYNAWKRGGCRAKSITYTPAINPKKVEFTSWDGRLEDICMNGADFEKVTMSIDFPKTATSLGETYTFDLIQKDENGNIIGGETFIVEAPLYSYRPIDIIPIEIGDGKYELVTGLKDEDHSIKWTNRNGEDVGVGSKITVIPTLKNNEFSVTALSLQGEMAQKSITLQSKIGLKSVTPTFVEDFMNIELYESVKSTESMLRISSLTQGGMILLSKKLPVGTKQTQLDVSSIPSGMYVLTYFVNGQIVDSQKFNKR